MGRMRDNARSLRLESDCRAHPGRGEIMAKGQQKKTKEVRKPKKEKPKSIAAAPSRGTVNDIKAR